ncbi:MAG: 2,3-bisphosphoglycerate-independent phosphoglycerate mutase [bacterium]|nr:2,3-bisphosphoglycerate-independent phosphoglycerate mutase [bacterium]
MAFEAKSYKPVVLLILDGLGVPQTPESTVFMAKRPAFENLEKFFPFTTLQASGVAVGLPWGEEGNSEVGHLTMGAGKVLYHHLPRIIVSIQDGSFFKNEGLLKAAGHVQKFAAALHFLGLFSSGSVHAYPDHLYALLEFAKREGISKVYLHLFTDGRDAASKEAGTFLKELELRMAANYPFAKIASLVGRDLAMDRDEHWDNIARTYNLLTRGEGAPFQNAVDYVASEYAAGRSDEFVEPGWLESPDGKAEGRIKEGDAVVFLNYREDSARELARAFVEESFDKFAREKISNLLFLTMTEYEKNLPATVLFPPLEVDWPLARALAERGLSQLHVAETEKYAHVTYFFNGGRERPYPKEERILIPSLPGAHFDETPEMSAAKITETVLEGILKYDFILANFANADMVGHTGNFEATVKALEVLDFSIGRIMSKVLESGGVLILTGDHGNAEEKRYRFTGEKKTKHTINPVPFFLVAEDFRASSARSPEEVLKRYGEVGGVLTDVAPTILELMQIPRPAGMSGVSLVSKLLRK